MFFQESTPDTSAYMIAGYVIAFLVMGLYVASIYVRSRNLYQDMTILEDMDKPRETARPGGRQEPAKQNPAKSE